MRQKTLVTICGAAIAASLFLPWTELPGIGAITPWNNVKDIDFSGWRDLPPLLLAFLASFALGALAALLAVIGWAPRLLAFVTALLPFGLMAYGWLKLDDLLRTIGVQPDLLRDLGLPSISEGISAVAQELMKVAGVGFYTWAGGAALLLLVALLDSDDGY